MSNPASRPLVLFVDDEPALQNMLSSVFTMEGIPFEMARNGQEAIDILSSQPIKKRILLLDLVMPVIDGWGVVRWLVEHSEIKAQTKIILMSANERLTQASDVEHDGELPKPFGVDALLALLEKFA